MDYFSGNMLLHDEQGVPYLTFPQWEKLPFVRHAFSTRLGGVSEGEFSSMNLSFGRGDDDGNVLENYRRLCKAADIPFEGLVASAQDHHTHIRRVDGQHTGIGIWKPRDRESVDGLITNRPGVALVTYYADCVPLFFVDPVRRAVGLAHSGWKGTVGRIGEKMVRRMQEEFGSKPEELLAAVGPSIGPCCYEVDEAVERQFVSMQGLDPEGYIRKQTEGSYLLDLWEVNRQLLTGAGILPEHLSQAELCTRCHHELLFSHRATQGKRGGMAAFLCIREE